MRLCREALAVHAVFVLLLAGCSGGKEDGAAAPTAPSPLAREQDAHTSMDDGADAPRKEFVIMRELVRQHELQQGNDKRIEAVERALMEKFPKLLDGGKTEEERQIYREAQKLLKSLQRK